MPPLGDIVQRALCEWDRGLNAGNQRELHDVERGLWTRACRFDFRPTTGAWAPGYVPGCAVMPLRSKKRTDYDERNHFGIESSPSGRLRMVAPSS